MQWARFPSRILSFHLIICIIQNGHVANTATKFEDPTTIRSWSLRVITFPVNYHWKYVRGHCTCAESRDPWLGGQNNYIFGIPDPDLPIHYTTSLGLRRRLRVVYSRASPFLKPNWLRKFIVRDLVTLTFDLLILNSYHTWRVTWPNLPPSLKTLQLFVHELGVITFPIDYHWKCVRIFNGN